MVFDLQQQKDNTLLEKNDLPKKSSEKHNIVDTIWEQK